MTVKRPLVAISSKVWASAGRLPLLKVGSTRLFRMA